MRPLAGRRLQLLSEDLESRSILLLSVAAVIIGAIASVVAFILYRLIMFFTNVAFYGRFSFAIRYPPAHIPAWMIIVPVIGGLIIGIMARYGTPQIRGHGIPEAMEAVIVKKSKIGAKVAILKPVSAAIAVGTGGPFGAEGPIIQTSGAIASLIGQVLNLTADERKVFLACGAAAGMTGIFNTPMAATALALELLLFEFRARSLVPVVIASAVAAALRTYLIGSAVMFAVPHFAYGGPSVLPLYVPLGIIIGIVAVVFSKGLFWVEELFEEILHIPMLVAPALGAVVLGVLGYIDPRIFGMGYATITAVIEGHVSAMDSLRLAVLKLVALAVSLGSGTSGGLLAPLLLGGSAIGYVYGSVIHPLLVPTISLSPNVCAIVGMSALFAAASRTPLTSFLFALELTGDFHAILPLLIGCMVADITARMISKYSVMTEKLAHHGLEVPTTLVADTLSYLKVRALMSTDFRVVPPETPVSQLLTELRQDEQVRAQQPANQPPRRHHWWVVGNPDGQFIGIVTRRQVISAQLDSSLLNGPVSNLAKKDLVVAYPDELMRTALVRMLQNDLPWLPVVARADHQHLLGYVSRDAAIAAQRMQLENEVLREGLIRSGSFRVGAQLSRRIARPAGPMPSVRKQVESSATPKGGAPSDQPEKAKAPSSVGPTPNGKGSPEGEREGRADTAVIDHDKPRDADGR